MSVLGVMLIVGLLWLADISGVSLSAGSGGLVISNLTFTGGSSLTLGSGTLLGGSLNCGLDLNCGLNGCGGYSEDEELGKSAPDGNGGEGG